MGELYGNMKLHSRIGTRLVLIFFVMNAIGTIYTNLFMLRDNQFLSEFAVHEKNMSLLLEMDWKLLFAHIFRMRLLQFAVFLLFSHVFNLRWALYILTSLLGAMFGTLVTFETAGLGAMGMLYGVVSWMPQGIFYGMVYYFLVLQARQGNNSLLERNWSFFVKIMLIVALLAVGSALETYLNPRLILFCNQHLVPVIKL